MQKLVAVEITPQDGRILVRGLINVGKTRRMVWSFDKKDFSTAQIKEEVTAREALRLENSKA